MTTGTGTSDESDDVKVFVADTTGPEQYACFFEDDGETGYLYVSDRSEHAITKHLQIYTNSAQLKVAEDDVRVMWSTDGTKCGVAIWGAMRGIIDLRQGIEGRAVIESRNSPAIQDREWLRGFE